MSFHSLNLDVSIRKALLDLTLNITLEPPPVSEIVKFFGQNTRDSGSSTWSNHSKRFKGL